MIGQMMDLAMFRYKAKKIVQQKSKRRNAKQSNEQTNK
jgi:hypothetical protein